MSSPTSLYRFYNKDGELLYVGITSFLPRRTREHAESKAWWREVSRVEVEHFETREQAQDAERAAVLREGPEYNIAIPPGAVTPEQEIYLLALRKESERLAALAAETERATAERDEAVRDARAAGMTWQQIGDALGVTRQRAIAVGRRRAPDWSLD